jgi:hypothetical protein
MYSEELWRHSVIMQLIFLRRSICLFCFAIGWLVLGFVASRWWADALGIAAISVLAMAAIAIYERPLCGAGPNRAWDKHENENFERR